MPGRQSAEHTLLLVEDVARRTGGQPLELFTSDENPAYAWALLEVYGEEVQPRRKGRRGRKPKPVKVPPKGLTYATVHKTRKKNRVVKVEARVVYGTKKAVQAALANSSVSDSVNTVYVERHNGTDRNRNARRARKTYRFSKDWWTHRAATFFSKYSYNFCGPVRTLKAEDGAAQTPAMLGKLADHVWTLLEWIKRPAVQFA